MKRLGAVLLSAAMVLSLTACGGNTTTAPAASEPAKEPAKEAASEAGNDEAAPAASASAEGTDISGSTLEVAVTYTGDQATTFQGLVKKFEEEYGCTVNIAEYGTDYENTGIYIFCISSHFIYKLVGCGIIHEIILTDIGGKNHRLDR